MKNVSVYIVIFLFSLLYRAFNGGNLISFELLGISIILTDVLSMILIISMMFRYKTFTIGVKIALRRYFSIIYIVTIYCSVLGIIEGNNVAVIFADFRIILGFTAGCLLGASYITSKRSTYQMTTIFYCIWGIFFIYSINIGMHNYINYRNVGLLRAIDPFLFELLGYILLLFPIVIILNRRIQKRIINSSNTIMTIYFILYSIVIAATKSLAISAVLGVIIILYTDHKKMYLYKAKKKLRSYGSLFVVSVMLFSSIIVLSKYDPIQLFYRSSLYRFTNFFGYSSFDTRLSDLYHMFDSLAGGKWIIGRGFGSIFETPAVEYGDIRAISPHIAIFTPLLKCGIFGFIGLSIIPVFFIINNWLRSIVAIKKNIDTDKLLAHLCSLIVFVSSYSMSGGWNFNTMVIVGLNSFIVTVMKKDLNVKYT
jgi:hypothetical protein